MSQTWTDGQGLTAKYRDFKMVRKPNQDYALSLTGRVNVSSEAQGLNIDSNVMDIDATPDAKKPKSYLLKHATATGQVTVLKTVDAKGGKQSTKIEGSKADYTTGTVESVVDMSGPVKLQSFDVSQKPTLVATGNHGVARLEPMKKSKAESGLRSATLDGSTKLVLTQIDPKSKKASILRTWSDHLLYEMTAAGKRITLTGSVQISGDNVGTVTGAKRAVFLIRENGNFQLETVGK